MYIYDHLLPDGSLEDALEGAQENYTHEFRQYWGLEDDEPPEHLETAAWREYRNLYRLVQKLANGVESLVRPRRVPDEKLEELEYVREEAKRFAEKIRRLQKRLREELPKEEYWDLIEALRPVEPEDPRTKKSFLDNCMQIEATRLFPTSSWRMGRRMWRLLDRLVESPGMRTSAYLSRVAECYVRGMSPEMAVMARAVLEAALEEHVPDNAVQQTVGPGKNGRITLNRRREAARAIGIFNESEYQASGRVKDAGDEAAHVAPNLQSDPDDILDDLISALGALEDAET